MISQTQNDRRIMSPEEYLAWETEQDIKHEYENGKIIAMTGGTIPHLLPVIFLSAIRAVI